MAALALFIALLFAVYVQGFVLPDTDQFTFSVDENEQRDTIKSVWPSNKGGQRIAIIGSGITGANAAFQLSEGYRRLAPPDQQPIITVFERRPSVGGRITQAYAYNDPRYPVDTCAATFAAGDQCVAGAASSVGLALSPFDATKPKVGVGVWDGKKIVGLVEEDDFRNPNGWSDFRKRRWYERYGDIPFNFSNNVTTVRLAFDRLLPVVPTQPGQQPQVQGKGNLTNEIQAARLGEYVQELLCSSVFEDLDEGQTYDFFKEVVFPGAVERFFGDNDFGPLSLSVLDLILGYENANTVSVQGGNKQLIERLLRIATPDIRVDTEVRRIERKNNAIDVTYRPVPSEREVIQSFDVVMIASSLELANLTIKPDLPKQPGLEQKYSDSYVTHFTSASRLNASAFNYNDTMPQNVLTVTYDIPDASAQPAFFSMTLIRQIQIQSNPPRMENLFKIVSEQEIPDLEILKYLTGAEDKSRPVISWIDRLPVPKSVPVLEFDDLDDSCQETLQEIELAPGIYYAGGGEQVVASVEFGCRMGQNAANLLLDKIKD